MLNYETLLFFFFFNPLRVDKVLLKVVLELLYMNIFSEKSKG